VYKNKHQDQTKVYCNYWHATCR